jgi:DNA helicase-2/ATP-dependent DNA helicase PcrA
MLVQTPGLSDFTNHTGSPIRANAGAGTGKTTAIVERVANLIESAVPARNILLMTFSRKAAENLRHRIRKKTGIVAEDLTIGTFHSVAAQELRRTAPKGKKPRIMDEDDAETLWGQAFDESPHPLPEDVRKHPERYATDNKARSKPKPEAAWKSLLKKNAGILRTLWSEQLSQHRENESFTGENLQKLFAKTKTARLISNLPDFDLRQWMETGWQNYERLKQEHNSLDYDDVLNQWARKLHHDTKYSEYAKLRWQHIIIDEYQDTNYLQEHIINGLNTDNLTVVGDPSQCIYAFRKAVPRLMVEFHTRHNNVHEVSLETNFRSKDEILSLANHILHIHDDLIRDGNKANPMGRLTLHGVRGSGGRVRILHHSNPETEGQTLLHEIKKLLAGGASPDDIVVLARTSFYNAGLEMLLRSENIPIQIWGGRSLTESKNMKDLLALLKTAVFPTMPHHFKRAANLAIGGERTHEEMFLRWQLGLRPMEKTEDFMQTITHLRSLAEAERQNPGETNARTAIQAATSKLRQLMEANLGKIPQRDAQELEAIDVALQEAILKHTSETGNDPTLEELISSLSLDPLRNEAAFGRVTLSTIHQAKGLEWPHVLIAGAQDNKGDSKLSFFRNGERTTPEEIEEECRLLYVAATRARDSLTLTYQGKKIIRFLENAPFQPENMDQTA